CAIANDGQESCTPDWGITDPNGSWQQSATFAAATLGTWTEWAIFPDGKVSNQVTFTVGGSPATPGPGNGVPPPSATSTATSTGAITIPPSIGVYIWGKQYVSAGNGPLIDPVNFAAAQGFHTVRISLSPRAGMDYGFATTCDANSSLADLA